MLTPTAASLHELGGGLLAAGTVDPVLLVSRFLHIFSAIVAVGGAVFMLVALRPAAHKTLDEERHTALRDAIRSRWAIVVHLCITLLLLSGFYNLYVLALRPGVEAVAYHPIFGVKFILAIVVFVIAIGIVNRGGGKLARFRLNAGRWLAVLVLLAAVIVVLSGALGQLRASSKKPAAPAGQQVQAPGT